MMTRLRLIPAVSVVSGMAFLACVPSLSAQDAAVELKVGDKAPVFEARAENGEIWKSSDVVGKKYLVVYFYPADMTPGCTRQACAYRDNAAKLAEKGIEVVGISGDSVRNHQLFKKAHNLNFTLLADEDGTIAKLFGVQLGEGGTIQREIDGRNEELTRGVTARRWTFIIGKDGTIVHKNTQVNPAEDSRSVIEVIEKLGA